MLPALRRGPGLDSRIGGQLSNQALQATFTKHASRTAQHLRATAAPSRREAVEELAAVYRHALLRLLPAPGPGGRGAAGVAARRRPGRPGRGADAARSSARGLTQRAGSVGGAARQRHRGRAGGPGRGRSR